MTAEYKKSSVHRGLRAIALAAAVATVLYGPTTNRAADAPPPAPAGAPAAAATPADPAAAAKVVADKGLAFLKSKQQPDGGWQTSPRDPPGISALVLRAFASEPAFGIKSDFVKKGYDKLVAYQKPDGGIYEDMLSNYNTAIAVSTLAAAKSPDYKPAIDRAVAFLKGIQVRDDEKNPSYGGMGYGPRGPGGPGGGGGGGGPGGGRGRGGGPGGPGGPGGGGPGGGGPGGGGGPQLPRADLSNTHLFIDALHDAGLKPDDPAYKEAVKFISRSQNRSESNDQAWAGEDGGFIYTPANGGNSNAGEYTDSDGKRMLRSYGLMTYAGLKSMIHAGLTKDDPRVKAAWDWVSKNWTLDEHPGMKAADPAKAKNGLFFYYHTLAVALHAYGEPTITDPKGAKHDWRVEFVTKVASLQQPDGSFVGDKSWLENNPVLSTSYVVLALQAVQADLAERPVAK